MARSSICKSSTKRNHDALVKLLFKTVMQFLGDKSHASIISHLEYTSLSLKLKCAICGKQICPLQKSKLKLYSEFEAVLAQLELILFTESAHTLLAISKPRHPILPGVLIFITAPTEPNSPL